MRASVKAKWLAALRSGEYEQTEGQLRSEGGNFCCLGVLCDLYAKEKGLKKPWRYNSETARRYFSTSGRWDLPPNEVVRWAGLTAHDPAVKVEAYHEAKPLSCLNDIMEMEFPAIADAIERDL